MSFFLVYKITCPIICTSICHTFILYYILACFSSYILRYTPCTSYNSQSTAQKFTESEKALAC
nr:MAG TPA: hypothetical protein [Bacteriophage sp.]DAV53083.1 MAG TPA: hypothetical protein [Caudoviricetes sp.]